MWNSLLCLFGINPFLNVLNGMVRKGDELEILDLIKNIGPRCRSKNSSSLRMEYYWLSNKSDDEIKIAKSIAEGMGFISGSYKNSKSLKDIYSHAIMRDVFGFFDDLKLVKYRLAALVLVFLATTNLLIFSTIFGLGGKSVSFIFLVGFAIQILILILLCKCVSDRSIKIKKEVGKIKSDLDSRFKKEDEGEWQSMELKNGLQIDNRVKTKSL